MHDGEILAANGIDGVTAQPRNAEKRFRNQAAHEQCRNHHHRAGEDRDQRIAQHMPEQHHAFRQSFGARRAHIVFADFFQKNSAIPPRTAADAADHADRHRQHQELERIPAALIAGNRREV